MTNKILANNAVRNFSNDTISFDYDSFVHRLLLFDQFIMNSIRLYEIPFIINLIGIDGLTILLESDSFKILLDSNYIAHMGISSKHYTNNLTNEKIQIDEIPKSYDFCTIAAKDYIHNSLQNIHKINNLSFKEQKKLKKLIVDKLEVLPDDYTNRTLDIVSKNYINDISTIKYLLANLIKKFHNKEVDVNKIEFHIEEDGYTNFKVESNLVHDFSLSKMDTFKLIGKSIGANINLYKKLEDMSTFNAYSGFKEDEIRLYDYKIKKLYSYMTNQPIETNMNRFLDIHNFPKINHHKDMKIDIEKLLKLKGTNDFKEFRQWINNLSEYSDKDIKDQLNSYSDKLTTLVSSTSGKTLRLLLGLGIGAVGVEYSIGYGAFDTFLTERVFKKKGYISFIHNDYSTIYKV